MLLTRSLWRGMLWPTPVFPSSRTPLWMSVSDQSDLSWSRCLNILPRPHITLCFCSYLSLFYTYKAHVPTYITYLPKSHTYLHHIPTYITYLPTSHTYLSTFRTYMLACKYLSSLDCIPTYLSILHTYLQFILYPQGTRTFLDCKST